MSPRIVRLLFAMLGLAVFVGGLAVMRSWGENWGATAAERRQTLPGDELLPPSARTSTMSITIHAPVAKVWPWIAQFGAGRGGLYSYAWFENLITCKMANANTVVPALQSVKPGDQVRLCAGDFNPRSWVVTAVLPGRALVMGGQDAAGRQWTSTYQIVLAPVDAGTMRLFWRSRVTSASVFDVLGPGMFVMMRGSLIGIQERAEGRIPPWYARESELLFWLVAFLGLVVAIAATAMRRRWQPSFLAAVVAALVTLYLVLAMPPVWLDVVGAVVVWAAVGWSFFTYRTPPRWGMMPGKSARPLAS